MDAKLFSDFRKAWVSEDVDWDALAAEEDPSERVDPEDPVARSEYLRLWGAAEVSLRMAALSFEHAGRYSLKFGNQGFDTSAFADDGKLWSYVTSPDVCYYDAEFASRSRLAYDVALYAETFRDAKAFSELSEALAGLFEAAVREDAGSFYSVASSYGFSVSADGTVRCDCYERFGLLFELSVRPVA